MCCTELNLIQIFKENVTEKQMTQNEEKEMDQTAAKELSEAAKRREQ